MKRTLQRFCCDLLSLPLVPCLFRYYYCFALNLLVRFVRRVPEVALVAVKRGYVEGGFIPAYSDLDVIIVIDPAEPAVEAAVLEKLCRAACSFRFFLLIFDHLSVFSPTDLDAWMEWGGCRRFESLRWKVVYERK